jgi:hypothetical protein
MLTLSRVIQPGWEQRGCKSQRSPYPELFNPDESKKVAKANLYHTMVTYKLPLIDRQTLKTSATWVYHRRTLCPSSSWKKNPDIGPRAVGYISSGEIFQFFGSEFSRPSNSLYQTIRGSGATPSGCTFPKSAHHLKISRSATQFHSRRHSDDACFYSARPEGTRWGFQSSTMKCSGVVDTGPMGYPTRKGEDLVWLGFLPCNPNSSVIL